jgi:hypothetical protein
MASEWSVSGQSAQEAFASTPPSPCAKSLSSSLANCVSRPAKQEFFSNGSRKEALCATT